LYRVFHLNLFRRFPYTIICCI